jgi:hypothetical protein
MSCCVCLLLQGKRLDIVRSDVVLSDLVGDVHCIIEAMIGRGGAVNLHAPQLNNVPEVRPGGGGSSSKPLVANGGGGG